MFESNLKTASECVCVGSSLVIKSKISFCSESKTILPIDQLFFFQTNKLLFLQRSCLAASETDCASCRVIFFLVKNETFKSHEYCVTKAVKAFGMEQPFRAFFCR